MIVLMLPNGRANVGKLPDAFW